MKRYSIKDLEKFTGIKAHTLRIWEQRYNLFRPERSDTNIRSYSEDDVKRALNIRVLYNNGFKISKIASLTESEVSEIIKEIHSEGDSTQTLVAEDIFLQDILDYNEESIKNNFYKLEDNKDLVEVYENSYIPLLVKIGELWQSGSITIAQEHFFSNLLRDHIISLTKRLKPAQSGAKKVVLFLHETELHELSLLVVNYVLKKNGIDTYYLGPRVPMHSLKNFVQQVQPDYMITSFIASITKDEIRNIFKEIATFFDISKLLTSGAQVDFYVKEIPNRIVKVNRISDLKTLFNFN